MRGHPPSQALRQHSAPPGAIREGVTPAAPILSRRRPRHGPSAVSPAFGGKTFSLFPRPAFTVRGRSGPPAMGGSLWGRTPGVPQARPRASFTHRKRAPPQLWPDSETTQCAPPVPFTLRAPSALPSPHSVLQCSLLPFSASQARTGVSSAVTGHRPLPAPLSFRPLVTAWTGAGGRGRCLGPARRHLLSPSG